MVEIDRLHQLLRYSHIAIGIIGLVVVWIPIFARKGGRLHIVSGRLFAWCAYYVGSTGLIASIWGIVHPSSFLSPELLQTVEADRRSEAFEYLRFFLSITGFLALAVLAGVTLGQRVMQAGERHEQVRRPLLIVLIVAAGVWGAGLTIYGAASLAAGYLGSHFVSPPSVNRYWINTVLGVIGVYGTIGDLRYVYGPCPTRMARWAVHIQCMIGSGGGFYAAFLLFGANRILALKAPWIILAPLVPVLLASIAAKWWIAADERQELNRNAET